MTSTMSQEHRKYNDTGDAVARLGCIPVQDEGRPDWPAGIGVQVIHPGLGVGEVLPSAGDLELHKALPPVIYLAGRAAEHAVEHLWTNHKEHE